MSVQPYGRHNTGWQTMPLGGEGYWDGTDWWIQETRQEWVEGRPPMEGSVIALHIVLILLTVWACGGWLWVFLINLATAQRQPGQNADVPTGRYLPIHPDGSPRPATMFPDIPPNVAPSVPPRPSSLMEPWMWYALGGGAALIIGALIVTATINRY